jgi:hypothetical protein
LRAEASAANLTAAMIAKPVAEAADIGAACVSVAEACETTAEATRARVSHALSVTKMAVVAVAKQGKNMVVGNSAATRNCCSHCQCPSTLFLRYRAELVVAARFIGKHGYQFGMNHIPTVN